MKTCKPSSLSYEEFMIRVLSNEIPMFCPFDGIWCERSSCENCTQMRSEYEKRWGKES